ncbi:MAG: hypothetical protein HPY51_01700 [Candidatus Omnitrophica bacterium]|nr:hypothetical protein [Candidatus Omnitrophota bacterium]
MNLCAHCARIQITCCQYTDVLVTEGDIARIAAFTGSDGFHEFRKPADPAYLNQPGDPNWILYTVLPDGSRRVLKQKNNRDCCFLGPEGCGLPREVRPLVCRLYPLDFTESGLTGLASGCPVHLLKPDESLLEKVGIHHDEAERWRVQLYHELRNGSIFHENRGHLRSAG